MTPLVEELRLAACDNAESVIRAWRAFASQPPHVRACPRRARWATCGQRAHCRLHPHHGERKIMVMARARLVMTNALGHERQLQHLASMRAGRPPCVNRPQEFFAYITPHPTIPPSHQVQLPLSTLATPAPTPLPGKQKHDIQQHGFSCNGGEGFSSQSRCTHSDSSFRPSTGLFRRSEPKTASAIEVIRKRPNKCLGAWVGGWVKSDSRSLVAAR